MKNLQIILISAFLFIISSSTKTVPSFNSITSTLERADQNDLAHILGGAGILAGIKTNNALRTVKKGLNQISSHSPETSALLKNVKSGIRKNKLFILISLGFTAFPTVLENFDTINQAATDFVNNHKDAVINFVENMTKKSSSDGN
jgi:hypothetical protein